MKRTLTLVALFLASFSGAQNMEKPITLSLGARSLAKAVEDLSVEADYRLQVAPGIAGEVVVIHVREVRLNDVMKRLADVTSGEWEKKSDHYLLIRSPRKVREEEEASRRLHRDQVKRSIDELLESLKPKTSGGPDKQVEVSLGGSQQGMLGNSFAPNTPVGKAIGRLLSQVRLEDISSVESGGRVVFATSPNAMQKPLGSNAVSVINDLVKEQNEAAAKLATAQNPQEDPSQAKQEMQRFLEAFGLGSQTKPITEPTVKALLVVEKQAIMPGMQVNLRLFGRDGSVLMNGLAFLNGGGMFSMIGGMTPVDLKEAPKPDPSEEVIQLSSVAKELEASKINVFNPNSMAELSAELRAAMLDPVKHDPLSFKESELLLATAQQKGLNTVACLPDAMLGTGMSVMISSGSSQEFKPTTYLFRLQKDTALKVTLTGKDLNIMPADPVESRRQRVDRPSLAKLINSAAAKRAASLDDLAAYAQKNLSPFETPGAVPYLMRFAPNATSSGMTGPLNWDALRFYGSLEPNQKQAMSAGTEIPIGSLSEPQKRLITKIVFASGARLNVTRPGEPPRDDSDLLSMISSILGSGTKDFRDEPTEIMPTGVPGVGTATMPKTESLLVFSASKDSSFSTMVGGVGVDELALLSVLREQPQFRGTDFLPHFREVITGNRVSYRLTFLLAPGVRYVATLNDDTVDPKSTPKPFDSLPEAFRKQVEQRAADMKAKGYPFPTSTPPPPPPLRNL
ncbi:MAG TPA: hypothetical protein PKA27_06615 [Fimbriimonadaceae bacterium]|nr:hypothetical protein [Fimbriimonadaceae bacterium]